MHQRCCIAVLALMVGCGDDGVSPAGSSTGSDGSTTEASSTTEDLTGSTSSGSSSSGSPPGAPPECDGLESPFTSAECLTGLRDLCRAATSEADCGGTEPIIFDGGYVIACGWAKVVAFSDADACTIASVTDRCEAGIEQQIGCADKCTDTPDLYASLKAIIADAELIEMPCSPAGLVLDGPLGPSSAVGAPPGETGTCAPDITPPAPEICMCADEACAAR